MIVTAISNVYLYRTERKSWASAARNHHILSYQLSGRYTHTLSASGRILSVGAGSLFFIRREDAYTVMRESQGEALCVTFDADGAPPTSLFACLDEPQVENLFRRLYSLRHIEDSETYCRAMAVLYELLAILTKRARPDYMQSTSADRIEAACRHIHAAFREGEIGISALSAVAGLGKRQFTTLFTRRYGTTPAQYIIELRLKTAAALLTEGLSVTQAAEAVGISDVYYFSRLFRRRFLTPPSRYAATAGASLPIA